MPHCPVRQPLRSVKGSLIGGYILLEKYHCMHILQILWVVVKCLLMGNCETHEHNSHPNARIEHILIRHST